VCSCTLDSERMGTAIEAHFPRGYSPGDKYYKQIPEENGADRNRKAARPNLIKPCEMISASAWSHQLNSETRPRGIA